jgi:hypothetical protein
LTDFLSLPASASREWGLAVGNSAVISPRQIKRKPPRLRWGPGFPAFSRGVFSGAARLRFAGSAKLAGRQGRCRPHNVTVEGVRFRFAPCGPRVSRLSASPRMLRLSASWGVLSPLLGNVPRENFCGFLCAPFMAITPIRSKGEIRIAYDIAVALHLALGLSHPRIGLPRGGLAPLAPACAALTNNSRAPPTHQIRAISSRPFMDVYIFRGFRLAPLTRFWAVWMKNPASRGRTLCVHAPGQAAKRTSRCNGDAYRAGETRKRAALRRRSQLIAGRRLPIAPRREMRTQHRAALHRAHI